MIIEKNRKNYRGFTVICICDGCGKEFERDFYRIKDKKKHYCNFDCRALNHKKGTHHTEATKQKMKETRKDKKKHNWNGGTYSDNNGYIYILKRNHPYATQIGYVLKHRLVMEQFLERILLPKEIVHHINKDVKDNRIENLVLFNNQCEHIRMHRQEGGEANGSN